jgi:hypothetical protein
MMRAGPTYAAAIRRPGGRVQVAIPQGGSAHVDRADNGVVVTVNDRRWNTVAKVLAPSASSIDMK